MFHSIDAWLWRRGIDHPAVRALLRNEILLTALALLGGGLLFAVTPWVFWFGVGLAVMAWTFWCLARFFLRRGLGDYSTAFLRIVIVRWLGRLAVVAADSVRRPGPLGRAAPGSAERHGHGLRLVRCSATLWPRTNRAKPDASADKLCEYVFSKFTARPFRRLSAQTNCAYASTAGGCLRNRRALQGCNALERRKTIFLGNGPRATQQPAHSA